MSFSEELQTLRQLRTRTLLHEAITNKTFHKVTAGRLSFIFFILVSLLFLTYYNNQWYGLFYIRAIQDLAIERITLPIAWWLGLAVYLPFGNYGLFAISIVMGVISILYLIRIFWNYKFLTPFLFPLLFYRTDAANWVLFFGRDQIIFMLSCIFTYYFYLTWVKKEKHYWLLAILAILALYTKSSGILLIIMFIAIYLIRESREWLKNGSLAAIPLFREEWLYRAWLVDLNRGMEVFFSRLKIIEINLLFPNSIFLFSFVLAVYSRTFVSFVVIFLTILAGPIVHNIAPDFYDAEVLWRYTFVMVPLNMLIIGESIRKAWQGMAYNEK